MYNVFSLTDLLFHSLSMNLLLFNMEFLPKTRRNIIPIFLRISHTICVPSASVACSGEQVSGKSPSWGPLSGPGLFWGPGPIFLGEFSSL